MKTLIIILACLVLAFVFSAVEKLRCLKHGTAEIPFNNPEELKKALRKYRDQEE